MKTRKRSSFLSLRTTRWAAMPLCLGVGLGSTAAFAQGEEGTGSVPSGSSGAIVKKPKPGSKPAKPVLVPPKLLKFKSASYPSEAQKNNIQGDVILELTIDKAGKVTAARTVTGLGLGHGLDEAAEAAAFDFEFAPATKDGKPIPVKIRYKYSFTLTEAEPEEKPLPGEPEKPAGGNIGGALRIAGTKSPLVGAQIVIVGADGQEHTASTSVDGKWRISDLPAGKYDVEIAAAGFVPGRFPFDVESGKAYEFDYALPPEIEGEEVTVKGVRPPREVTKRTVSRREINRIPGTSGDALRSIQSLPGVARPPGLAGLLIVRGSSPQDTETYIDGSNVPLIYHFGGLSSVVPTELLERIDFYPGNFSAKYGRVQGGIVDVALRAPDISCNADYGKASDETGCYHAMAQVDLIDTRAMVQGPLGPFKGWSFVAAGRRSWFDVWLKPVLEEADAGVSSAPVYNDYQFIVEHKQKRGGRLSARFYGSNDKLELLIRDVAAEDPAFGGNLAFSTSFYRAQLVYQDELTRDISLETVLSVGRDKVNFGLGQFLFDIEATPISTRSEFGFNLSEGAKLNVGMDFLVAPYDIVVRAPPPPRPGEPDPGPFATRPVLETRESDTVFRPAWYAEAELTPHRRLRVVPGARVDFARDTGHADFSPRFTARYDLVNPKFDGTEEKPARRTTFKGGVGVFHQPPTFQETDDVFGTPGLESNRSLHYALGVEQELTRHVEVGVEGFYKDMNKQVARNAASNGSFLYNNDGEGSVVGLETLLKYKPDSRFFGWLAYTLSRSVRKDAPDEEEYLFQYDQTHNLTMLGSYRLGRGWEFGARFRIISGSLNTPALQPPGLPSIYVADAGTYGALQGDPLSERLPMFHQIDIRVDKRWQFKDWRLSAFMDIQNAYNNRAREAIIYNYNFSQRAYQEGLPILPSLGLRGEF